MSDLRDRLLLVAKGLLGMQVLDVGYGAAALAALAALVGAAKADDPMAPVTVLAPSSLSGIAVRRHLARGVAGRPGVAGLDVTTLTRLAERHATLVLAPRRPATRAVLTAAVRRALAVDPGPFADVARHPGTALALARAYEELRDTALLTGEIVEQPLPLPRDVVALCRRIHASLSPDWYDATDLLDAAAGLAGTSPLGTVVAYLPQDLTHAEQRFLAALDEQRPVTVVAGVTGATRANAGIVGERAEIDAGRSIPTASRVLTASDSDDEIRLLVRDLLDRLGEVPAHRIAIFYPAARPYARLLHEHLTEAGLVVNGAGVRPVDERAAARVLLDLLALSDGDVPRADLFRVLSLAPLRDETGERIPVSRWERASRSAGVVAGQDWEGRLATYVVDLAARHASESAADEPRAGYLRRLTADLDTAQRLGGFVAWLRAQLQHLAKLTTWFELSATVTELSTTLLGDAETMQRLPAEEQYAAAATRGILGSLAALDAVEGAADLATFRDVLDAELAASLPRVGRYGDGVLVAPLASAIGLDLDLAYVVGLAEDLFPGRTHPDPLLPDAMREAAGLPGTREIRNRGYRHLLTAFTAAESVVSFPRGDLRRSTQRLPSRWLLSSLRELASDSTLSATAWDSGDFAGTVHQAGSYAGELLHTSLPATEQEWRTRAITAGTAVDDPIVAAGALLVTSRSSAVLTRFDGNLTHVPGLPDYRVEDRAIAPTTLEGYAKCPHAFFVQRLLGVEPVEQPEDVVAISAMDIGNLIHHCMDELVRTGEPLPDFGEPWTAEHHEILRRVMHDASQTYQQRGLTGHPRLWEAERLRIAADLEAMLLTDDDWRAERSSAVVASELRFGTGGEPPVEVAVPGGRVLLRGSADKVDRARDGALYVTDLKTGSNRDSRGITQAEPFLHGAKLQLPVYAYAARARFGDADTPVSADYWFVRKTPGRVDVELTPTVEAGYAEVLSTLVGGIATGLFPAKAPNEPDFLWVKCPYCNPDGLGHGGARDRWERKRADPALAGLVALIEPA